MKRSFMGGEEEDEANKNEKQPRKLNSENNLSNENDGNSGCFSGSNAVDSNINILECNDIALKEINNEKGAIGDLPSLNDSFVNNISIDLSTENVNLKNRITELEKDLTCLQKRHNDVLNIKEGFNKKESKIRSKVYTERNQNAERAKIAEEIVKILEGQLLKSQEMVKSKDVSRLEVQHQLNNAQKQIIDEKNAKEKALFEVDELQIEMKQLRENLANKDNLIQHMNNKFNGQSASKEEDTVTIEKLQQQLSTKEKTIEDFQRRLEKAYESVENLKDEKSETLFENERLKICDNELRNSVKAAKENINKLENQLEEVQKQLFHQNNNKNDEISREKDFFVAKISEFREIIKEKNQQIASLQKDLNVEQVFCNEKIEKAKAETKLMEEKLTQTTHDFNQLIQKYNDIKLQKDNQIAVAIEEKKEFEAKMDTLETKEFIKTAYDAQQREGLRASEAAEKVLQIEAKYLQCQTQLTKEIEERWKIENRNKKITEELGDEIVANEKVKSDLEKEISKLRDELLKVEEKRDELKKKFNESENERENAAIKYKKLEESNKNLTKEIVKVQSEFAASKQEWKENVKKFAELHESLNAFCNR
uniref:Uncharacterized protein n=1 Tax=Panagrolaimus superbus TaxID=310955 RepID=A0A914Z6L0_9BILA